ncbi:N,N-dimethylformamidase beta subunit family domain-containing protein [Rhodobacteraceae bacterium nBUS_24]
MITGYSDRLSARPRETIRFMVSTDTNSFELVLVQLHRGAPDLLETALGGNTMVTIPGREQPLCPGSYGLVEDWNFPGGEDSPFTIGVWAFPTLLKPEPQAILATEDGLELGFVDHGVVYFRVGDTELRSLEGLPTHRWYHITVRQNESGLQLWVRTHATDLSGIDVDVQAAAKVSLTSHKTALVIASCGDKKNHFNGKLSDPCIFDRWLDDTDCESLANDVSGGKILKSALAAWDFSKDRSGKTLISIGTGFEDGILVQLPVCNVTGPHWRGQCNNPSEQPRLYAAIHFHEDSLSDAGWEPSFEWTVPDDLSSGIYAAKLTAGDETDYLPFAVLPPKGTSTAEIAVLMPTFTYQAYGNELWDVNGLNCLYDHYTDGSSVSLASHLLPMLNLLPRESLYRNTNGDAFSRHLNADLSLLYWLTRMNVAFDVLSDHHLHNEGVELLSPYKVVATGSHPEYVSGQILDGIEAFLQTSGSLMYLGGNGFYWVTDMSDDGSVLEVRRPNGTRPSTSEPGESFQQLTGELGGLWKDRGRPPQKLTGVGFIAQGWTAEDRCGLAQPYTVSDLAAGPAYSDLFAGLQSGDSIGAFQSAGLGYGAAGDEIDRVDTKQGSPVQTKILATANGFEKEYRPAIETQTQIDNRSLDLDEELIRADLAWIDLPSGGAVFSTGSINWISSLCHNECENSVSAITLNAIKRITRPK